MNSIDKDWLRDSFPTFQKRVLRGDVLNAYYRAEMLLNGWDNIKKRGCYCQHGSLKDGVESKYTEWLLSNEEKLHQ